VGTEAALVWTQPLGRTADRAARRARRAAVDALREVLAAERLRIAEERETAWETLTSARQGLDLIADAVADAKLTLGAEDERFRQGEGRSQNVLDAQKALTDAEIRLNSQAAVVLNARFDWVYANGSSTR
jgi:outer membrane protein TolC